MQATKILHIPIEVAVPSDGDTLVYNITSGKWEFGAGSGGYIAPVTQAYAPVMNDNTGLNNTAIGTGTIVGKYTDDLNTDWMDIDVEVKFGNANGLGSSGLTIPLPAGYTFDQARMSGNFALRSAIVGKAWGVAGGVVTNGHAIVAGSNVINISSTSNGASWKDTAPGTWGNGDYFNVVIRAPIIRP